MKFCFSNMFLQLLKTCSIICFFMLSHAGMSHAQTPARLQTGNKVTAEVIVFGTRGREIIVESTSESVSTVEATNDEYTFVRGNNKTKYSRNGHYAVSVESASGTRLVPEAQRFVWMPPNGDFGKPWSVKSALTAPQSCGGGLWQFTGEAKPKNIKTTINFSGKPAELDAVEIAIEGKWSAGSCGTGRQIYKVVYVPIIDLVAENMNQSFQPNGFLYSGRSNRVVAID